MPDEQQAPPSQEPASSKRDQVLAAIQRIYRQDQYIEFDDSDQAAYIVHDGTVQVIATVVVNGKSHEIELAILKKGSYLNGHKFFGIDSVEKSYEVRFRTLSRVVLIRFTKDKLPDQIHNAQEKKVLSGIYTSFLRSSYEEKASLIQGIINERQKMLQQGEASDASRIQLLCNQLAEKDGTIRNLEDALIQSSRTMVKDQTPEAEKIRSLQADLEKAELRAQQAENLVTRLQRALKRAEFNSFRLVQNQDSAVALAYQSLQGELDEARQAQVNLEQRVLDLKLQTKQPKKKFSQAEAVLHSEALESLEQAEAQRREVSKYFEEYAGRMHRALELLFEDNPDLVFAEDARMLWLGEEPPPRDSVIERQRIKRSATDPRLTAVLDTENQDPQNSDPDTAILGSRPPELARPQKSNKTTDRMQPRNPKSETRNAVQKGSDPVTNQIDSMLQGYLFRDEAPESTGNRSVASTWDPEVPDNAPRETIPFDPDEDHPAQNSDVVIPKAPLSVRAESLIDSEQSGFDGDDTDDSWDNGRTSAWEAKEVPTRPSPQPPEESEPENSEFPLDEPDTHTRQILEDASHHPFSGYLPDANLRRPAEFIPDGVVSPPSSDELEDYTRPYGIPRPPDVPGP